MTRAFHGLVVVILLVQAFVVYQQTEQTAETHRIAQQGAQAHTAMCTFKAELASRAAESAKFLAMTPAEIRQRYGALFAEIPKPTIAQSLHSQRAALASLAELTCS